MMNELEKCIRTYLTYLLTITLSIVEICVDYLYDITQIFFSHAMDDIFFFFRKCANMLLFCGNIRLMM